MNIPKTAKLGLACAAALSYSVIPTYLLKYRWIFRSRQRASREEKVLYLTFDRGICLLCRTSPLASYPDDGVDDDLRYASADVLLRCRCQR